MDKEVMVMKALEPIQGPYTKESGVYLRAKKGLMKLTLEELDALLTLVRFSVPEKEA